MTKEACEWCGSEQVNHESASVYWELPDGKRAIEITETPSVSCSECHLHYQKESIIKEIEDQLFLIDTKLLGKSTSF